LDERNESEEEEGYVVEFQVEVVIMMNNEWMMNWREEVYKNIEVAVTMKGGKIMNDFFDMFLSLSLSLSLSMCFLFYVIWFLVLKESATAAKRWKDDDDDEEVRWSKIDFKMFLF